MKNITKIVKKKNYNNKYKQSSADGSMIASTGKNWRKTSLGKVSMLLIQPTSNNLGVH